jgi:hypothetical protein
MPAPLVSFVALRPCFVTTPIGRLVYFSVFACVLTRCRKRHLDRIHGAVKQAEHELVFVVDEIGNQLPAFSANSPAVRPWCG